MIKFNIKNINIKDKIKVIRLRNILKNSKLGLTEQKNVPSFLFLI